MNKSPPVTESSYYIHQRYEDTAQLIFHQQQKKKKELSKGKHSDDTGTNGVEVSHYGNPGVLARKEAAQRLEAFKKEEKKKEKDKKGDKRKEDKKEEKQKEDKQKQRRGSSDKRQKDHVFTEKYTPLASPSVQIIGRRKEKSATSLGSASRANDSVNDSVGSTSNANESSSSFVNVSLGSAGRSHFESQSTNTSHQELTFSPNSSNLTSNSEAFVYSPSETTNLGAESGSYLHNSIDTSFGEESFSEFELVNANGKDLDSDPETSLAAEAQDSLVEFGHHGNTGVIAKKHAVVARATSILRKDRGAVESKICTVM